MNGILFFQALIIGILCYLGAVETPWLYGVVGGYYIFRKTTCCGTTNWYRLRRYTSRGFMWTCSSRCFYCKYAYGGHPVVKSPMPHTVVLDYPLATTKRSSSCSNVGNFIGQTFD